MNEFEKYFRYIIPGMTFVIELILYLLFSGDLRLYQFFKFINSINIVFSVFILSGGLGFLFGVFYYILIWCSPFSPWGTDFRKLYEEMCEDKNIIFEYYDDTFRLLTARKKAHLIVHTILDYHWSKTLDMDPLQKKIKRLSEIVNSLGTVIIASLFALISWSVYHCYILKGNLSSFILLPIALLVLHIFNFKHVVKDYQTVFGMTFRNNVIKKNSIKDYYIPRNDPWF